MEPNPYEAPKVAGEASDEIDPRALIVFATLAILAVVDLVATFFVLR